MSHTYFRGKCKIHRLIDGAANREKIRDKASQCHIRS